MKKIIELIQRYKFNKERKIIISCIINETPLPLKLQQKILKSAIYFLTNYTKVIRIAVGNAISNYNIKIMDIYTISKISKLIPIYNANHFNLFGKENGYINCKTDLEYKEFKIQFITYLINSYK